MKKEYLILILIIIGLSAYLVLKKDNQVHYELPVLPQVDTETIDRIQITKADRSIMLNKTENTWTLNEDKYPADKAAVDDILDTIKELTLSALVSEAGDLARYELDDANAVKVKVFSKDALKREFSIGKAAPSFNHTFVMVDGTKQILQADKSFRNHFDKSVGDLRDKLVLEFEPGEIKKITLEKQGTLMTLIPASQSNGDSDDDKSGSNETTEDKKNSGWVFEDGTAADKETIDDLLSSLSHLECQSFLDQDRARELKKETPLCKITLENKETLGLNLFKQEGTEDMAGISKSSPYAFTLAGYKTGDIVSYVDKLLGLEKPEETESDKE
ncbi:MAG: DUF4340 domain-containing protein [Desulfobacterales bacterium]|nr:DUF4340 domain-containing protein [Desulfobacterales bacterium]